MSSDYDFRKVDNIRVIGRFRPVSETEKREEKKQDLKDVSPSYNSRQEVELVRLDKPQNYKCVLDHIFRSSTTQKQVFNIVGRPMVQACLEGYNATIFAYGQTGSGKTFTMFGPEKRSNDTELGLVQRCCTYLFDKLKKRTVESASRHDESSIKAWQLQAEFIQVYKDNLSDLLAPQTSARSLQIKTNFQTDTPYVENLKQVPLNSIADLIINLTEAHRNRVTASHKLNSTSSRSHMLLMLTLEQQMQDGSIKRSKLNFGDLAGSEDVRKALGPNPDKTRLREAIAINSSLTALTTAITMLTKKQRPSYRSSPLTHILQDSLGGNSKTTMIVAASPHTLNRQETIRTLRFAESAKHVKNRARVNKEQTRAQLMKRIEELEAENSRLKTRVIELETGMKEAGMDVELTQGLYDDDFDAQGSETDVSDDDEAQVSPIAGKNGKNGKKAKFQVKGKKQSTGKKGAKMELTMDSGPSVGVGSTGPTKVRLSTDIQPNYHRFSQTHSIPTLLKQIEGLQRQMSEHNGEVSLLRENNKQLEIEVETLTGEFNRVKDELDAQLKENEKLSNDNKACQQRIDDLAHEKDQLSKVSTKKEGDLDKQIQRLRNNVQTQMSAKTDLQKQNKQLNVQNENLADENESLRQQLAALKRQLKAKGGANGANAAASDAEFDLDDSELQLREDEKNLTPAELLLHRFADVEATDVRLSPEQRMKKTSKMMTELSGDIKGLMDRWLPANKVRQDRKQSEALVYRVRQLIGHFNVLYGQLQEQKSSYQNDLKLDLQKKKQEISALKEENSKVLQLKDDLAEKDDVIEELKKRISQLMEEKELLHSQTQEQQDMIHDVQQQVIYLTREVDRSRSTATNLLLSPSALASPGSVGSGGSGASPKNDFELGAIDDGDENEPDATQINNKNVGYSGNEGKLSGNGVKSSYKKNGADSEEYEVESVPSEDEDNKDEEIRKLKESSQLQPGAAQKKKQARKSTTTLWREQLEVGDQLDCCDESGLWWTAKIVGIRGEEFKIRYDGWSDEYDEFINKKSKRLAMFKTQYAQKKGKLAIIKEGIMQKEGKMFKTWRKRYFILFEDGKMCYYHKKGEENAIGSFDVHGTKKTERVAFGKKGQQPGLQVETGDRVWKFKCDSEQDVKEWIGAINHVVKVAQYEETE